MTKTTAKTAKAKAAAPVAPPPAVYPVENADVTPSNPPTANDEAPTAKEDQPQRADSDPVITGEHYDNDAVEGGKAVRTVTLTFADGSESKGSAPRTDDLAADQAEAKFQAIAASKAK